MKEETLTKYYTAIAQKVNELIPCEWERVVMYGEETGDTSTAWFYFYTEDGSYHHNGNIWEEYDVSERTYDMLMQELREIDESLWQAFKDAGEEPWYSFTFDLAKNGKFKIKYSYEKNEKIGGLEKLSRWAYDELEIIPNDITGRKYLKKYLIQQKRELPEILKDI